MLAGKNLSSVSVAEMELSLLPQDGTLGPLQDYTLIFGSVLCGELIVMAIFEFPTFIQRG